MSNESLTPGFMIIHGNQPEQLRQLLVHWFKAHPLDPLEDETILVQSNGIAQWIKLGFAASADESDENGFGIAAAMKTLLPSRFMWQVYRTILGQHEVPEVSVFDKPLLVWRLMRLLPGLIQKPGFEPLARFLRDDADLNKRYQLAEKIADLFDQYQVYRADWLTAWSEGRDVLLRPGGAARPIEKVHRWQPMLWRDLLSDVGELRETSRAAVHQRFMDELKSLKDRPTGLLRRVTVFGVSSLPRQSLDVLQTLARVTQVILCVHNPCEHYWADLISERDHARRTSGRHARKLGVPETVTDEALHLHGHPLLASWGKQGRDYIAVLEELDEPDKYREQFKAIGQKIDVFDSHGESTLLNQLQDDIRLLRSASESRKSLRSVDPAMDRSIRFHIAHSMQREVEVLQDQLLAAFEADETLRPRHVIVMVPDINAYAPHIQAVFGQIDKSDDRYIPFSIADQAKRHREPLVNALEFLLGVSESRLAVSDILDLLDVPAVRARFAIDAADLPLIHRWIEQSTIRWGLNAGHRTQFIRQVGAKDAPKYEQNTWLHGLKRMLLGYAVGSDPTDRDDYSWNEIEPYGEVAGLDAALVGPLARLLFTIEALLDTLSKKATPYEWEERLQALLQDFFQSDDPKDSVLLLNLRQSLQEWREACRAADFAEEIPLAVVREHWLSQIDQSSLAQRFMAGWLTFATLMPMRAIPFRMVCLLGMNDGDFPRSRPPVDFDLMAHDHRSGDRSRRDDDRYLFLEALLSAREKLHISWVGKSIQDNSDRPPSVLVSQLRDHIETCWRLADPNQKLLPALTVEHKLQAFSRDYFGNTDASPFFTYAKEWERKADGKQTDDPRSEPLTPPTLQVPITLSQLAAFLKDPVKTFFQERLRVFYAADEQTSQDQEPFQLDGLEQWTLQNQLIQARLDALVHGQQEAESVERQLARIRRSGELPLGKLADLTEQVLEEPLDPMFKLYGEAKASWPLVLEDWTFKYSLKFGDQEVHVQDTIGDLYGSGGARCRIELNASDLFYQNNLRHDKLLGAWVLHLASHASGQAITTEVIGKNGKVTIKSLDQQTACKNFDALVDAYVNGLCEPQPLAPTTGFAWLRNGGVPEEGALAKGNQNAVDKARGTYEDGFKRTGEANQSPYRQRAYPNFETLWSNGRFTTLCDVLYAPLLGCVGKSKTSK